MEEQQRLYDLLNRLGVQVNGGADLTGNLRQSRAELGAACREGSCLWASEIEEFPIAVTKTRFSE